MKAERIGFVGLGVMGMPMARHLAAAGHSLTVHDLNRDASTALQSRYSNVRVAPSSKEVAAESEIVITMLPSGREVFDAVFGTNGLLQGFKPGDLLLDTSSSEPWYTKEIAAGLSKAGVTMVDGPVSGAEAGALSAELVFMVGGDAASVDRVLPLLTILGKRAFHLGPLGSGHVMKSINNLITSLTFLGTAEGLIIGKKYGLDPAVMNDVLNESTGMSWITGNHIAQRILTRRFDDPFKYELMMKDINIALRVAADLGLKLSLSEEGRRLWQDAQARVPKGGSVSELVRALELATGVELTTASA